MKASKVFAMLLLGLSIAFTSCEKEPKSVPVTGITLDSASLTMTEGETARLTATISPSNADNQGVIWSSSNASVASVSNGTVTAVSAGSATITAKSDDGGKTATCNVTVNSKIVAVTGVSLDKTSLELTEGDEYTLVATVLPENASNKSVSWKSEDETIATVSDGKVKAIKPGNTSITVSTSDGNKTATCSIKVNEKIYHVESVTLDKTSLELTEGDEATLTATVLPENASNKNILWSSSNENVATVSNGLVKAVAPGTTSIIAKSEDGEKTATCDVKVKRIVPEGAVDLGLSVLWATCNLGATSPEEYGDYYAWGASEPWYEDGYAQEKPQRHWKSGKSAYHWGDYPWGSSFDSMTKYNTIAMYGPNVDNKIVLDQEDDAAHVKLGGTWRMPTSKEIKELITNCTSEWTEVNGISGMMLTSKRNGNSIFLAAAGCREGYDLYYVGGRGYYWSSSLNVDKPYNAHFMYFYQNYESLEYYNRCWGHSIRPVCE